MGDCVKVLDLNKTARIFFPFFFCLGCVSTVTKICTKMQSKVSYMQ